MKKNKIRLSVAIATFNEVENIGRCLESVKNLAEEVVVVDGSSSDGTLAIIREFPVRVIITSNKPMFHINKNLAINNCQGEWVLQLDADEIVSTQLAQEIKTIISQKNNRFAAYWLKRKNFFLGRYLAKGGQYPDPVIRLFKKGKAKLPAKSVHEQMIVEGEVGWLKNDLLHWATPHFSRYWLRENRYASLEAEKMLKDKLSLLNPFLWTDYLLVKPLLTFFNIYLRHKGFIDCWQGFIFAFFSGFHFFWAFLKYLRMKTLKITNLEGEWR